MRASPLRAFARRCSNRFSFETGAGAAFHEAVRAAASSACVARNEDGAAKPTNGPSRTATTSFMAVTAERSSDSRVAPYEGPRRTLPYSIPGRTTSEGNRCAPVTRSRAFGRVTD